LSLPSRLPAIAKEKKTASPTPASTAADNTAKNERDRSGDTKTSGDQSNSAEDIKLTADIRKAVVGDGSLSMTAKNIKIISANGVVTLRGPVNTAAEKAQIEKLARNAAGKAKIENQLEVKPAK
jgi:Predicted periplasmic or secreted lipoprotein